VSRPDWLDVLKVLCEDDPSDERLQREAEQLYRVLHAFTSLGLRVSERETVAAPPVQEKP
jgi:hypothetical protein